MINHAVSLAVVGDLHGYAVEMLQTVAAATAERGRPFAAVLCVGDIGVIESEDRIDRATRKWAYVGKPELGIAADPNLISWPFRIQKENNAAELDALYAGIDFGGPPVPILCVDGNHDDHGYLARLAAGHPGSLYPVDPRHRWQFFRRGQSVEIGFIRITGCGGIRPPASKKPSSRHLLDSDYQRLGSSGTCDILLTHETPAGIDGISGDICLRNAGLRCCPVWWFFGHMHKACGPVDLARGTKAVSLGLFNQDFPKRPGIMGILDVNQTEAEWRWFK